MEYTTELEMTSAYSGQVTDVKYTTTTTDLFLQDWKRRSLGRENKNIPSLLRSERKKQNEICFIIREPLWFCYYRYYGSSSSPTKQNIYRTLLSTKQIRVLVHVSCQHRYRTTKRGIPFHTTTIRILLRMMIILRRLEKMGR